MKNDFTKLLSMLEKFDDSKSNDLVLKNLMVVNGNSDNKIRVKNIDVVIVDDVSDAEVIDNGG